MKKAIRKITVRAIGKGLFELPCSSQTMRVAALIEVESRAYIGAFIYLPSWVAIAISTEVVQSAPEYSNYITAAFSTILAFRFFVHLCFKKLTTYNELAARLILLGLVLGGAFLVGIVTALTIHVTVLGPAFYSMVVVCGVLCTAGTLMLSIDPAIRYVMPIAMLGPAFFGFISDPTKTNITLSLLLLVNVAYLVIASRRSHLDYWGGARARSLLEEQSALFEKQSLTDGLTKIPNRLCAQRRLSEEWSRSRRDRSPLSLLMVDIDLFKSVNDNHGHLFGDECLITVARELQSCLRSSDFIARYGGEEFIVVLPSTIGERGLAMAERLRKAVSTISLHCKSEKISITCSIGLTTVTPYSTDIDADAAIDLADQALYRAKQGGRNQVVVDATAEGREMPYLLQPDTKS